MASSVNFAALGDGGEISEEDMTMLEAGELKELGDWKPGSKELAVMTTLAVISLMVALDATILVSVLPVGALPLLPKLPDKAANPTADTRDRLGGVGQRRVLGRDVVSSRVRSESALHRRALRHLWAQGAAPDLGPVLHHGHGAVRAHRKKLYRLLHWPRHPGYRWWWHHHHGPSHLRRHCPVATAAKVLLHRARRLGAGERAWPTDWRSLC
jgi:hypothetical protein